MDIYTAVLTRHFYCILSMKYKCYFSLSLSPPSAVPPPSGVVFAFTDLSQPYYAGLDRELDCALTLNTYSDPNVMVTMTIMLNNSTNIDSGFRRMLRPQQSAPPTFRRSIRFRHLLSTQDTGNYTCSISVTTNIVSNYIVNSSGSKTSEYIILGKCVCVYM